MKRQEPDPGIRKTNITLSPLKRVASRLRISTQNHSETGSQSGAIMRPKPGKGYQPAEYITALDYFKSQAYTLKAKDQNGQTRYKDWNLFAQTFVLEEYGLGVYLYFEFIKRLAATFLIMTAFTIVPIIYAYMNGKGLSTYKSSYTIQLARTSIGNISDGTLYGYLVFTVTDLLSMIVLFGFYLHWRSFHQQAVTKQTKDTNLLNPSHYALSVVGFDPSTPNLQQNLQKYITHIVTPQYVRKQYPGNGYQQIPPMNQTPKKKIFEVQVMNNFNGCFSKFIEYDELIQEKQKQRQLKIQNPQRGNQQFSRISKQIVALEKQLSKISQVFEPYEAIIHFENIKARFDFINFQRRYSLFDNFSNSLKRFVCCSPLPPRTHLFMQKEALLIKTLQLSRPQQINWQNLDISGVSRVIRWIFSLIFLVIAIAITSSAIALCTLYVSSTSACSNFDVLTTLTKAQQSGGQTLYCYCAAHFTEIYSDIDIETACSSISSTILYSNLMQVGASLVSSISNIILITAVSIISKYVLKPSSRPLQYSFIFVGVLLSNYINASILPLIMNGDIFGFHSLSYLKFISFIDFSKVAIFKDYTTDWYAVVAPYYMNFLIIAILSPIINLVVTCLWDCFTKYRVKKACQNTKTQPIIQKEANKLMASNQFDLATQKAIICLNFFISVMYSSLIPILIPITTLYLIISFFCKKYIVLRYSIRIPADAALSQKTINLIPFVILLHFLMGIWSHTADGVFKQQSYVIKLTLSFLQDKSIIIQRAFIDILMLGGGALIAIWIIFDYTLVKFFTSIIECFKDQIEVPLQLASSENKSFESQLQQKNILGSYKLPNNPNYGHAIKAYHQLKKRQEKEMRRTFNNTKSLLKEQTSSQQNFSPIKFGQQTMESINLKGQQEIVSLNELLPNKNNRYDNQQE